MIAWLRRWLNRVGQSLCAHDMLMERDAQRLWLVCMKCGRQTNGWAVARTDLKGHV